MSIELVHAAILAKLSEISVANGYITTPLTVTDDDRKDLSEYGSAYPVLALKWMADEAQPEGPSFRRFYRVSVHELYQFVRSTSGSPTPSLNLYRDVVKALETDQSLGLGTMLQSQDGLAVLVTENKVFDLDPSASRGYQGCVATIRVVRIGVAGEA